MTPAQEIGLAGYYLMSSYLYVAAFVYAAACVQWRRMTDEPPDDDDRLFFLQMSLVWPFSLFMGPPGGSNDARP